LRSYLPERVAETAPLPVEEEPLRLALPRSLVLRLPPPALALVPLPALPIPTTRREPRSILIG